MENTEATAATPLTTVRAKFKCANTTTMETEYGKFKTVEFNPVMSGSEENKVFAKATPGGSFKLQIDESTPAFNHFKPSVEYYIDITEAPKAAAVAQ